MPRFNRTVFGRRAATDRLLCKESSSALSPGCFAAYHGRSVAHFRYCANLFENLLAETARTYVYGPYFQVLYFRYLCAMPYTT